MRGMYRGHRTKFRVESEKSLLEFFQDGFVLLIIVFDSLSDNYGMVGATSNRNRNGKFSYYFDTEENLNKFVITFL